MRCEIPCRYSRQGRLSECESLLEKVVKAAGHETSDNHNEPCFHVHSWCSLYLVSHCTLLPFNPLLITMRSTSGRFAFAKNHNLPFPSHRTSQPIEHNIRHKPQSINREYTEMMGCIGQPSAQRLCFSD